MQTPKSFMNAVKWSYTASWGERAFGALFTVVLAAVLGPKDFGLVAIALIYINFLQMFLDQGLAVALIQKKNLEREHLNAVFWLDMALSLILVAVSFVLSRWWASVNHAPQAATIIPVLSLCIPIEGLALVQKTLLSREMDFKSLSIRSNLSVLLGGAVGLTMAFTGFGVWALVGQQITKDLSALLLLWRLSPWRPSLGFSWSHLKSLLSFSISNFIAQLGMFADGQASSILIAVLMGPYGVGLYRLADRVVNSIVAIATSSIQAVSLPEFSRFQDQRDQLRMSALNCIRLSSTVTLPALAGLAAIGHPLMLLMGPQWLPASPVLKILCALAVVNIFHFFTGPMLQALSRAKDIVVLEWGRTIVGVACLLIAGYFFRHSAETTQLMAIAWSRFFTGAIVVTPVFLFILMRLCGITIRDLIVAVAPSALTSAAVIVAVALFHAIGWLQGGKLIYLLAAEVSIGAVIGSFLLLALDLHLRSAVLGIVHRFQASRFQNSLFRLQSSAERD
jgi:O-antigen/teichoic acid export membrane protein